jgi:hypothetical protein
MMLLLTAPPLTREHIHRVAARQFREEEVQRGGTRTLARVFALRCSDDLLWLP